MILVLKRGIAQASIAAAQEVLSRLGLSSEILTSGTHSIIVVHDDVRDLPSHHFTQLEGVDKVVRLQPQCPMALDNGALTLSFKNGATIGGGAAPIVIAGPCSVESAPQIHNLAKEVKSAGAQLLRGGAFKPRTSPYDFRGLGREALEYLAEARKVTGLPVVSEVMSASQVEEAEPFVDVFQVGARNMYNYELLKEVGRTSHPVLLKRAMSATLDELLQAAEYILCEGNLQVILCERGIRTFDNHTRNTLDLSGVAALKNMTQLPVIVDPSHGTGRRELIRPMSRAAIACGADGLIIEVHQDPAKAMSDSAQAITPGQLQQIVADANAIHQLLSSGHTASALKHGLHPVAALAEQVI